MTQFLKASSIFAATLCVSCVAVATGELVTFQFEGEVTSVQDGTPPQLGGPFDDWPEVGAPFSGSYTIDSSAVDRDELNTRHGAYVTLLPHVAIAVIAGDYVFEGTSVAVSVFPSSYQVGDHLSPFDLVSHPERQEILPLVHFNLGVLKEGLFQDDSQPLVAPSLTNAASGISILLDNPNHFGTPYVGINGSIRSLYVVPEPPLGLWQLVVVLVVSAIAGQRLR